MSTTVHVANISHDTSEKEVRDFFSFCGKITTLSITPTSGEADAAKSASVTFEKETAAKTALLLDNTQLGGSQVHVTTASTIDQVATSAGAALTGNAEDSELSQEDKPRSRIAAEYLAHGYKLSDSMIQQAIALDQKHGLSSRFTSALTGFDQKYQATDKAKAADEKYQVTQKATGAWNMMNSYFEKALDTPTGQKVRTFYMAGDRQVRDVHNEARRLADLKSGKVSGSHDEYSPETVKGTEKTVCGCGGKDGVCGCAPGKCGCASCGKSSQEATVEVKEAAQASGQSLPHETFGTSA